MATLNIKVSSGNLESYEALLLQFPDPAQSPPVDLVELNFGDTSQVFPSAFALMAAYIARTRDRARRPVVSRRFGANPVSAKLERAMDGFAFLPALAGEKDRGKPPAAGMVPLVALTRESLPEQVAQRVLDHVLLSSQPTRDMKETLFVLVCEMVENVVRHASGETPGYLCGQLSAQKKKLELALVDAGQGVKASFLAGKNAAAAERVRAGESALRLAMELAQTSSEEGNTGFGLHVAAEAVKMNKGMFRLTSGNETLLLTKEGAKHRTHAGWNGTVVNFLLNLNNVGPLAEIYRTLLLAVGEGPRFFDPAEGDRVQGTVVPLKPEGVYQGSRLLAGRARQAMADAVRAGGHAVADADGIAALTPGFADECFGELLAALGEAEFRAHIYLKNANDSTRLLLEAVLGRRVRPIDPKVKSAQVASAAAAAAAARAAQEEEPAELPEERAEPAEAGGEEAEEPSADTLDDDAE